MPLVVQTTVVDPTANSYGSLVLIKDFANMRGRILPDDDAIIEAYAIRAMDYIESFRDQYKGEPSTGALQTLSFPRDGVQLGNMVMEDNFIPAMIVSAQAQLVVEQSLGVELQPTFVMQNRVKRKKIGPLDTEWFDGASTGIAPIIATVDVLLAPLFRQFFGLRTQRV